MSARLIEATAREVGEALDWTFAAEAYSQVPGFLQSFDPRAKIVSALVLITSAAVARNAAPVALLLLLGLVLGAVSSVDLRLILLRLWMPAFVFAALIALPSLLVVQGRTIAAFPVHGVCITAEGVHLAGMLVLRSLTAVTCMGLLVLSTPWSLLLCGFSALGLPAEFTLLLAMCQRYMILLADQVCSMMESRRSRQVGRLTRTLSRRVLVDSSGAILLRSLEMGEQVAQAMEARGFRAAAKSTVGLKWSRRDWLAVAFSGAFALGVMFTRR
jgi:cobalt/nickel transport system permease protein